MSQPSVKTQRQVLVCVCGGIAAYKVCHVVSRLVQRGVDVNVAMTANARQFVGAATFEALSGRPVHTDLWHNLAGEQHQDPPHIRLARDADLIVVAPATANMIAKMAHGLADDLVSSLLLAANPAKVFAAPAMNEGMLQHPATQRNLAAVAALGVTLIGPDEGWQACRTTGKGRMTEPEEILASILQRISLKPA